MKNSDVDIFGLLFLRKGKKATYKLISKALDGKGAIKIFTPNAEILYRAKTSPHLRAMLNEADLLLPDGVGIIAASRILKKPLPCRITGIDTSEFILSEAEKKGLSVYLLGGNQGVALMAAESIKARFPKLIISGAHHGYFTLEEEKNKLISHISAQKPHILFVCLGFPAQERFIVENAYKIPSLRLSIGLGGSLDVWSGRVRRAPSVMQKAGLEWLYRIVSQPRRITRLPYLLGFCSAVLKEKWLSH